MGSFNSISFSKMSNFSSMNIRFKMVNFGHLSKKMRLTDGKPSDYATLMRPYAFLGDTHSPIGRIRYTSPEYRMAGGVMGNQVTDNYTNGPSLH